MKSILKSFKKSEVAIYSIAIMLVAAGYLNYTTMNKDVVETNAEQYANIGDARLVNSDEVIENETIENKVENNIQNEEIVKTEPEVENTVKENAETKESEKAIETNSTENDYFANSKLERDTNYASIISNYTAILEKDKVSETEKKIAMQEISNINNTKNAIMICENILSTKGFENSVIFINDKSINVVVRVKDGLNKEKVAQVQNIISRELNSDINNIHITEK